MTEEEQRLFTLANTAALVLFNENGSPPTITLSQKVLAEHGKVLLEAYKEMMVIPAMEAAGKDIANTLVARGFAIVPIEPTPEMREAFHAADDHFHNGMGHTGYSPDQQWAAMLAIAPKFQP